MAMARKLGLDLEKMIGVVSGGAAGSWQLANLGPKIAAADYAPGFMVKLILKDLRIVSETADENQLPLKGTDLAHGYLRQVADEMDGGELGTQAMAKAMEKLGRFVYRD
jgi:3-hydroxyisobutyrate dehydrogenase